MHRQIQNKPCVSWRYIDVLRLETIGLCEKLNSIYIIFFTKNNLLKIDFRFETVLDGWHVGFNEELVNIYYV